MWRDSSRVERRRGKRGYQTERENIRRREWRKKKKKDERTTKEGNIKRRSLLWGFIRLWNLWLMHCSVGNPPLTNAQWPPLWQRKMTPSGKWGWLLPLLSFFSHHSRKLGRRRRLRSHRNGEPRVRPPLYGLVTGKQASATVAAVTCVSARKEHKAPQEVTCLPGCPCLKSKPRKTSSNRTVPGKKIKDEKN